MIMLEIKNVKKTFNKNTINEKKALNGINLQLNEGDFVTVIGGNGAGKSTTLNMIAGVYPIDSGRIEIDGINISRYPEYKRAQYIGRVFQDPMMGTAAGMEIQENMALAYRRGKGRGLAWGIRQSEKSYYQEALKKLDLGLENRMTNKVGLLSGGQRQALTLLMATLQKPKILLLDEHTAALDPKTAKKVLEITEEIVGEQNLTTMMITHNMKDAIQIGNRLIMMHEGKIIYDISGEEKNHLEVEDLLRKFEEASGEEFSNDRMILAK
jgi:putative ABC transport system ATP-binding protein